MASSLIERKWRDDLLGCIVCKKELSDPRTLPCVHAVCMECLQHVGHGKAAGELMPCPVCEEQFEIPRDGLVGMQKNYFILKLMNIEKMLSSSMNIPCDFCSSISDQENPQGNPQGISEEIPHAIVYCVDCQQKICEPCREVHKKVKTSQTHTFVDLKDKAAIKELAQTFPRSYYCDRHSGEPVSIFCGRCRLPLCHICYGECHISHPYETVETASGSHKNWMLEEIKEMSNIREIFKFHSSGWEKHKNKFTKKTDKVEAMIKSRTEDLKQKIDEYSKQLLQELSYIMERGLVASEEELDFWVRRISMLEHSEKYLNEVMLKGTAVELQQTICAINPRNFQWHENDGSSISDKTLERSDRFQYIRSNLDEFLSIEENNMVGKFVDLHLIGESRVTSHIGELSGITYLGDRIFTIHRRSKVVRVFESHPPFDRLPSEDIDLINDQDPRGICATTVCHSIFVIATEEQLISRIAFVCKASDKVHTVSCWQLGFFPRGISVSVANDMFIMGFKRNTQKEKDGNQKDGIRAELGEDNRLTDGYNRLPEGRNRLPDGDNRLPDEYNRLPEGGNRLSEDTPLSGDNRLSEGDNRLPDGNNRLSGRDNRLSDGDNRSSEDRSTEKDNRSSEEDTGSSEGDDRTSDGDSLSLEGDNQTSGDYLLWSLQLHIGSQFSVFNPLIPIPEECWKPIQAVQTSRRTFLVLYRRVKMGRICVCEISNSGAMLIPHFEQLNFPDVGLHSDPCFEIDENDDLFVGVPGIHNVIFVSLRRDESRVEKQLMEELKWNMIGVCYVRSKRWLLVASTGPAGTGLFSVYSLRRPLTAQ